MGKILLASVCAIVLVSGLGAKAEEMMSLQEFLRSNPTSGNDNSSLYVLYRCTALMTVLMALTPDDAVGKVLEAKMSKFFVTTTKLQSEIAGMSQEEAAERVMKTLEPIGKKYVEAANKNYVNRGNYLGGSSLLEGDLKICGAIKF